MIVPYHYIIILFPLFLIRWHPIIIPSPCEHCIWHKHVQQYLMQKILFCNKYANATTNGLNKGQTYDKKSLYNYGKWQFECIWHDDIISDFFYIFTEWIQSRPSSRVHQGINTNVTYWRATTDFICRQRTAITKQVEHFCDIYYPQCVEYNSAQ